MKERNGSSFSIQRTAVGNKMSLYVKQTAGSVAEIIDVHSFPPSFSSPIPPTHFQSLLGLQLYYLKRIFCKSSEHSWWHTPKQLNCECFCYSESSVIKTKLLNWKRLFNFVLPAEKVHTALQVPAGSRCYCSWYLHTNHMPVRAP